METCECLLYNYIYTRSEARGSALGAPLIDKRRYGVLTRLQPSDAVEKQSVLQAAPQRYCAVEQECREK